VKFISKNTGKEIYRYEENDFIEVKFGSFGFFLFIKIFFSSEFYALILSLRIKYHNLLIGNNLILRFKRDEKRELIIATYQYLRRDRDSLCY